MSTFGAEFFQRLRQLWLKVDSSSNEYFNRDELIILLKEWNEEEIEIAVKNCIKKGKM